MKMLAHLISIHIGQKWDIFSALGRSAYTAVWASEFQRFMYLRETIHPHLTFNAWPLTLNLQFKVCLVASSPLIPLRIWCLKEITTQVLIQETFIIKSPKILYFFRDPKPPQNLVVQRFSWFLWNIINLEHYLSFCVHWCFPSYRISSITWC